MKLRLRNVACDLRQELVLLCDACADCNYLSAGAVIKHGKQGVRKGHDLKSRHWGRLKLRTVFRHCVCGYGNDLVGN